MHEYSFPNQADDHRSRLVYTVAAQFIYRLDLYLQCEHREARYRRLDVDIVDVVKHCCEAAIDMFCGLAVTCQVRGAH